MEPSPAQQAALTETSHTTGKAAITGAGIIAIERCLDPASINSLLSKPATTPPVPQRQKH